MSCAEYVCKSCGHFAGGSVLDRPVICSNPKCPNPTEGFALEWDERLDYERELLDVDYEEDEEIEEYDEGFDEEDEASS